MKRAVVLSALAIGLAPAHAAQVPLVDVAQLSARGSHACVVTTAGAAKCWGSNGMGELGSPVTSAYDFRTAATDVTGLASGVVAIAAATGQHTCAIVTGGGVKCWGSNGYGQLGDGTTASRPVPGNVLGLPGPAVALSAGEEHTCALTAQGAVACWGRNFVGALGDGTEENRLTATPVVGLSSGVVAISAGPWHTCAMTGAGALKCWGWNSAAALGDGTFVSRTAPVDVVGLSSGVTAAAAGGDEGAPFFQPEAETCAIASGVVKCWGRSAASATPVDVAGVGPATHISIGGYRYYGGSHTTQAASQFCVLTPGGGVRCWGSNWCGMAGGPNSNCGFPNFDNIPPTDVTGLSSPVVSVSAGSLFTCALRADARVDCWGNGHSNPLPAKEGTTPQTLFFYGGQENSVPIGVTVEWQVSPGGGSGNPVVVSSRTPGICSVSGTRVTTLAAGLCTIEANQAGNAYYDAATPATLDITVTSYVAQTVTFDLLPAQLEAGGVGTVTAHASSGLPVTIESEYASSCTISGNVVRVGTLGSFPGTCYLRATQPGNATYAPAIASAQIAIVANTGTRSLVVYARGGGTGTVTSTPAGIDCGISCAGNFASGSSVTLAATASAESAFDGWIGACSGTGTCTVMMDQAKTVTALFDSGLTRLSALSTRGPVVYGNGTLIGGFIIGGSGSKTVMVRARGPSLAALGVPEVLANPMLHLVRAADGMVVATSDDWRAAGNATDLQASGFQPTDDSESAILITLEPGAYTAVMSGAGGTTGNGIVEVFRLGN